MKDAGTTILMVEDEVSDIELLTMAFARTGLNNPVQTAGNGEEAVDYLTGKGPFSDRAAYPVPKAIITDLKMPQMGGIELLRWIKANPRYRVIPTIVLTSSTAREDVNEAYDCGASAYFVKPVPFSELMRLAKIMAEYWQIALTPDAPRM
ncbi:MAG: response regulator [Opitutaceae bacterium]